ncbi:MAG: hypothetical protein SPJ83_05685 [Helicobacter sp.]|uniref:Uncharacterized protein n=1 Tax=Helicobacter bilis ATCC 43879 TaxID=613026 RepID=T5LPB4_9HELI|nr:MULTISPECIES: hypothetical protein [Helicobacter]EQM94804.1 hypothetical protein HRAG_02408 [Helicobacter bilis ATCC 43879]MCI7411100.1 hypothetical protein [Helicobacter bilis]MDD7297007.1 hypothetical protein [Helicobacter bilis]MDY4400891.1 hypothetical protein [Helicobacter bilis]MDY5822277.1 hypothetical protein [Helicobacter sp.]
MWKLLENIGLGLFVNALYSIMNLNFETAPFIVLVLSVILMSMSIYSQRKNK